MMIRSLTLSVLVFAFITAGPAHAGKLDQICEDFLAAMAPVTKVYKRLSRPFDRALSRAMGVEGFYNGEVLAFELGNVDESLNYTNGAFTLPGKLKLFAADGQVVLYPIGAVVTMENGLVKSSSIPGVVIPKSMAEELNSKLYKLGIDLDARLNVYLLESGSLDHLEKLMISMAQVYSFIHRAEYPPARLMARILGDFSSYNIRVFRNEFIRFQSGSMSNGELTIERGLKLFSSDGRLIKFAAGTQIKMVDGLVAEANPLGEDLTSPNDNIHD